MTSSSCCSGTSLEKRSPLCFRNVRAVSSCDDLRQSLQVPESLSSILQQHVREGHNCQCSGRLDAGSWHDDFRLGKRFTHSRVLIIRNAPASVRLLRTCHDVQRVKTETLLVMTEKIPSAVRLVCHRHRSTLFSYCFRILSLSWFSLQLG